MAHCVLPSWAAATMMMKRWREAKQLRDVVSVTQHIKFMEGGEAVSPSDCFYVFGGSKTNFIKKKKS